MWGGWACGNGSQRFEPLHLARERVLVSELDQPFTVRSQDGASSLERLQIQKQRQRRRVSGGLVISPRGRGASLAQEPARRCCRSDVRRSASR